VVDIEIQILLYRVLLPLVITKWESIAPLNQMVLFSDIASWFPHTYAYERDRAAAFRRAKLARFAFALARLPLYYSLDEIVEVPSKMPEEASTSIPSDSLHPPTSVSTWKQILEAGIGYALVLEHSFFLHQQNIQDPVATAAELYNSSGVSAKVAIALTEFNPQHMPEWGEMLEFIMNLTSEHIISKHVSK